MPAQNAPANQTQNNSPRRGAGVGGKEAIRRRAFRGWCKGFGRSALASLYDFAPKPLQQHRPLPDWPSAHSRRPRRDPIWNADAERRFEQGGAAQASEIKARRAETNEALAKRRLHSREPDRGLPRDASHWGLLHQNKNKRRVRLACPIWGNQTSNDVKLGGFICEYLSANVATYVAGRPACCLSSTLFAITYSFL